MFDKCDGRIFRSSPHFNAVTRQHLAAQRYRRLA